MNDTHDRARDRWDAIVLAARTPEEHACVATATRVVPVDTGQHRWHGLAIAVYEDMLQAGAYAGLNDNPPTPAHAVELDRIATTPDGADGPLVPQPTRLMFLRREWITTLDRNGQPVDGRDWACRMFITEAGAAVAAAVLSQPPDLTAAQAVPLLDIHRAGDAFTGSWPGDARAYRVAVRFKLVIERRPYPDAAPDWFVLTERGLQTLNRWRSRQRKPVVPNPTQAALLTELETGNTRYRENLYPVATYQACRTQFWTVEGEKTEHGSRPLFITAAGREALVRYRTCPPAPTRRVRTERRPVHELTEGMIVRLANRSGYRNLGAGWITVHRIITVPRVGNRPGGYRVVFLVDGQERTYAGGKTFTRTTRFEIKAERS